MSREQRIRASGLFDKNDVSTDDIFGDTKSVESSNAIDISKDIDIDISPETAADTGLSNTIGKPEPTSSVRRGSVFSVDDEEPLAPSAPEAVKKPEDSPAEERNAEKPSYSKGFTLGSPYEDDKKDDDEEIPALKKAVFGKNRAEKEPAVCEEPKAMLSEPNESEFFDTPKEVKNKRREDLRERAFTTEKDFSDPFERRRPAECPPYRENLSYNSRSALERDSAREPYYDARTDYDRYAQDSYRATRTPYQAASGAFGEGERLPLRDRQSNDYEQQYQRPYAERDYPGDIKAAGYVYPELEKPKSGYKTLEQRMIAVHVGKGGAGKSTITKELGALYSISKVNNQPLRTLIVETDFTKSSNQAMFFDVDTKRNLFDWARRMAADAQRNGGRYQFYDKFTIEQNYITQITDNLFCLFTGPRASDEALIDDVMMDVMLRCLEMCDFDVIIVDTTNDQTDPRLIPILKHATDVLIVMTLDTTTFNDTVGELEDFRLAQIDTRKFKMVVNTTPDSEKEKDMNLDELVNNLRLEFITAIPRDKQVRLHNNAAEPMAWDSKKSPAMEAIKKVANEFVPIYGDRKKGLISRLFGGKR